MPDVMIETTSPFHMETVDVYGRKAVQRLFDSLNDVNFENIYQ